MYLFVWEFKVRLTNSRFPTGYRAHQSATSYYAARATDPNVIGNNTRNLIIILTIGDREDPVKIDDDNKSDDLEDPVFDLEWGPKKGLMRKAEKSRYVIRQIYPRRRRRGDPMSK